MYSEYLSKAIEVNSEFEKILKECENEQINKEMVLKECSIKEFLKVIGACDFENTIQHKISNIKNNSLYFKIDWDIVIENHKYGFFSVSSDYESKDPFYYTMETNWSHIDDVFTDDLTALQFHVNEMKMIEDMENCLKEGYPMYPTKIEFVSTLVDLKPRIRYFLNLGNKNVSLYIRDVFVCIE